MRAYSHIEQEFIARQVFHTMADGTRASMRASTEEEQRANEARAAEPQALIQMMVDLECESKFRDLVQRIVTRMPKL